MPAATLSSKTLAAAALVGGSVVYAEDRLHPREQGSLQEWRLRWSTGLKEAELCLRAAEILQNEMAHAAANPDGDKPRS